MASITRFYALILSTVLLISGVPGFFPSIPVLQPMIAIFALTQIHSMVHIAVGLLGLLLAALGSDRAIRFYTFVTAILYGALAAAGFLHISFAPWITFNGADNMLHVAIFALSLGIFLVALAEARFRQRKARILAGLPVVSVGGTLAPAPRKGTSGPSISSGPMSRQNKPVEEAALPWYNPATPASATPTQDQAPGVWSQNPWSRFPQEGQSQPIARPSAQPGGYSGMPPSGQPYDDWRSAQYQPPAQPAPNPWALNELEQDTQPQETQRPDQWPLDEWPSLDSPFPRP